MPVLCTVNGITFSPGNRATAIGNFVPMYSDTWMDFSCPEIVHSSTPFSVADLHSKILDARPPSWGSKFFQFHAVFGKIWPNRVLAPPPGELAPPPRGNPGSATDFLP